MLPESAAGTLGRSVATRQAPPADPAPAPGEREHEGTPVTGDIRRSRPFFLAPSPLRNLAFRLASVVALVLIDLVSVGFALYGALVLRDIYLGSSVSWGFLWSYPMADYWPFVALITVLVFWQAGLYAERERRAGFGRVVSSFVVVALLVLAFGLGTGHRFNTFGLIPTALLIAIVLDGLLRVSYDAISREALHVLGVRRRAIVVGEGEHLHHLLLTLGSVRAGIEYEFVGVVTDEAETPRGLPRLGRVDDLPGVLDGHAADELIVTDSDYTDRQLFQIVDQAHRTGVKVKIAPKTTELLIQRAEYVPGQGVPLFELRPPVFAGAEWAIKRSFDLLVGCFVIVVGLPLWLAIAAAIKLTSRGPVFYRDPRIGLGEKTFGMFKFRTMVAGAAEQQPELEHHNEAEGALFKIRDDPRVTPVGKLLRRFSIDELPNMLNVVRGQMSLVGPRPLPLRDHALLEDWHRKRSNVLPGMTGLWQISGRSDLSFDDLVRLDFYYLENWSIWLDITILAKTLPAVVASRGAY
jgi:exopolysaccharide biosynthesis polyprenyl glycosylphosphotransferase